MKNSAGRTILFFGTILICAAVGQGQSVGSGRIDEVKFQKGTFTGKGTVTETRPCPPAGPTDCGSGNSHGYFINGKKGERINISLASNTGRAAFSIFNSKDNVFLKNGAAVKAWVGTLPSDGNFRINVFTHKGNTRYTLRVVESH